MYGVLRCVLLVVPLNTIANWENEFEKWLDFEPTVDIYNLSSYEKQARPRLIQKWQARGGVLLLGNKTFPKLNALKPDILVLDEAHTMVSSKETQCFRALSAVQSKRKILLTGSPFQNNLSEFYNMCEFIRPGIFGLNSTEFDRVYVQPILAGMASDSSTHAQDLSTVASHDLNTLLKPHVHRVNVSVLAKDLPPLIQAVIHVRQSRVQSRLLGSFQRAQKMDPELKNFFKAYAEIKPISNHPYCLLMPSRNQPAKGSLDSSDSFESPPTTSWWESTLKQEGVDPLESGLAVESGYKIVLLLHILAKSEQLGEKVLVFSQSLKSLDYIERVLALHDWKTAVPSLRCFADRRLGGWANSRDYLRIDGDTTSSERGGLVDFFNQESNGTVRAFLISSQAGGVGINLTAASRVVLLDAHFNPTVQDQALFRAYRYGQQRPVFCYRMLTEGTMEEKVYSRSVNKQGLALRVIDRKTIKRSFSAKEVEDLNEMCTWVQCDSCEKWRMLIGKSDEQLPEKWSCDMNTSDPRNNSCDAPERSQVWYERNCDIHAIPGSQSPVKGQPNAPTCFKAGEVDDILNHLLSVSDGSKTSALISRHYYHNSLLDPSEFDAEELELARKRLEEEKGKSLPEKLVSSFLRRGSQFINTEESRQAATTQVHAASSQTTPRSLFESRALIDKTISTESIKRAPKARETSNLPVVAIDAHLSHDKGNPKSHREMQGVRGEETGRVGQRHPKRTKPAPEVIDLCANSDG